MLRLKQNRQWKVAVACAFGTSMVALTDLLQEDKKKKDDVDTHHVNPSDSSKASQNNFTNRYPILKDVPATMWNRSTVEMCKCEGIQPTFTNQSRAAALNRRQTIRVINSAKTTQQDMRFKYQTNWKRPLGEGAFGTVYLSKNRITKDLVAMKKIPKQLTDNASFQNEVNALVRVRNNGGHPYICGMKEIFEDKKYYYMVLDLVSGGEMFEHLITLGAYSEADASRLVKEVSGALSFLHGTGIVHGDLKPENLMLSTQRKEDSTVKLVDFGCAQISTDSGLILSKASAGNTPAYCPPEVLENPKAPITPAMDVWGLGIILYIMLTGLHPFDLNGNATDDQIERLIKQRQAPPLQNSPITAHMSDSAIDVIEKCIKWDPKERITAMELLEHPWVRGITASEETIAGSSKKLSMFREFKTKLEAKVFADFYSWSDDHTDISKKTALVERAFQAFDSKGRGFITSKDLRRLTKKTATDDSSDPVDDGQSKNLSLSGFSNMLGENMVNKYFPRGHVMYKEGDIGNHMYFINSGIIEVTTKDGSKARRYQGDFFGEGALLHPKKIRSATIQCVTPLHAIEISREYFEKYLASSGLALDLKEKDRTRKRNRAKTILRLQKNLKPLHFKKGDIIFKEGSEAEGLFIVENGSVDVCVQSKLVFSSTSGDIVGEHSLVMNRPRNTTAICASDDCLVYEMIARDFYELYNTSRHIKASLREVCFRREFQKALVKKTKKEFPNVDDLREVFDAADIDRSGCLSIKEGADLLKSFDPSLTDEEVKEVLASLDLDSSGKISFNEFKIIFGMNEAKAKSI